MAGQRYAILIGNRVFPEDVHLGTLRCPENDVIGLTKLLESEHHGPYVVTSVIDKTNDVARKAIYRKLRDATSEDLVLIYYSGHGKLDDDGNLYLLTKDSTTQALPPSSIPVEDIKRYTRESSASTIVVVLDCCFSGAIKKMFKGEVSDQASHAIGDLKGEGRFFLTASTDTQLAEEKDGDEYSLLTKYIIEGVRDGNADLDDDGKISFHELCLFVQKSVAKEGRQKPKAWFLDASGDVVIASSGKPGGDKKKKEIIKKLYDLATQDFIRHEMVGELLAILNRPASESIRSGYTVKCVIENLFLKIGSNSGFVEEAFRCLNEVKRIEVHPERVSQNIEAIPSPPPQLPEPTIRNVLSPLRPSTDIPSTKAIPLPPPRAPEPILRNLLSRLRPSKNILFRSLIVGVALLVSFMAWRFFMSPKFSTPSDATADLSSHGQDQIHFTLVSAVPNQPIAAKVTKRNTGRLDALHVVGFAIVEVYDGSKDRDTVCQDLEQRLYGFKQSGQTPPEQTVPVGQEYILNAYGRTISEDDAKAISIGTEGVYVAGFFTYSDNTRQRYNWRYRKRLNEGSADTDCAGRPWNHTWTF